MIAKRSNNSSSMYSAWFGKTVVLHIAIRQCCVPVPCSIVGESIAGVRICVSGGWEMDLRKELILAIEEYTVAVNRQLN